MTRRALLLAAGAVIVLAAASTITLAAVAGAFDSRAHPRDSCAAPSLPGSVVSVQLVDMRAMTGRPGMPGGPMRQGDWRHFRPGMMRVLVSPASVTAGPVSLVVANTGYLTHELVVLPLGSTARPGVRSVGGDGTVDESASLGEASASCASGDGDGIAAGSTGWVTLHLPAGRYELVCNRPGHYAAGMYAELDVR